MPRVTTVFVYALPGPPQSFSAKTAEEVVVSTMSHQQMRYYRAPRGFAARSVILALFLGQELPHTGIPLPKPQDANWTGTPVKIEVSYDDERQSREDAERGHGTRPRTDR